ncbi:MAG TPA: dephospho-CoA kinase [Rhizomicrobium sp.]|nr:dephospho-CoA kinase [Rhizomicrobium sp.]
MSEPKRPLIVGLTGSIGMGKTETAKMFASLGIPIFDADAAVHRLYETGGEAVPQIAKLWPDCVRDGRVDRSVLAAQVTAGVISLKTLEAIVGPFVARQQQAFIDNACARGAEMVVLDIPLLFEAGGHRRVDAVVVVSAPAPVQRERVLARPGMTPEKLDQILERQMPDAEKRAKAHFVVETGKGLEQALEQVKAIVAELQERSRS